MEEISGSIFFWEGGDAYALIGIAANEPMKTYIRACHYGMSENKLNIRRCCNRIAMVIGKNPETLYHFLIFCRDINMKGKVNEEHKTYLAYLLAKMK